MFKRFPKIKHLGITAIFSLVLLLSVNAEENEKHLFILSGQSNMANLKPELSFIPAVEAAFGKDNVIVVKDAQGGQSIRRWYKNWAGPQPDPNSETGISPRTNDMPGKAGDLYDRLMAKVNKQLAGTKPTTVTFVWMQGESDTNGEEQANIYKESLLGLLKQLREDMKRDDIYFVIGRLSRFKKDSNWETVRKAQVEVAESSPRGAWIDTDDLEIKAVHYTADGSKELGRRFAEKAIALFNKK
jgi:hypothetical protein